MANLQMWRLFIFFMHLYWTVMANIANYKQKLRKKKCVFFPFWSNTYVGWVVQFSFVFLFFIQNIHIFLVIWLSCVLSSFSVGQFFAFQLLYCCSIDCVYSFDCIKLYIDRNFCLIIPYGRLPVYFFFYPSLPTLISEWFMSENNKHTHTQNIE